MNTPSQHDQELVDRIYTGILDVLIKFGLCVALVALCYRVFSPFLTLMVWALILAVTLYPLHRALAQKVVGKQWMAATILVIPGSLIIVAPTALLMNSLGDSIRELVHSVQDNKLTVRAPNESVQTWPIIGETVYSIWSQAHTDLPALMHSMQPKIGDLAREALGFGAGVDNSSTSNPSTATPGE